MKPSFLLTLIGPAIFAAAANASIYQVDSHYEGAIFLKTKNIRFQAQPPAEWISIETCTISAVPGETKSCKKTGKYRYYLRSGLSLRKTDLMVRNSIYAVLNLIITPLYAMSGDGPGTKRTYDDLDRKINSEVANLSDQVAAWRVTGVLSDLLGGEDQVTWNMDLFLARVRYLLNGMPGRNSI